MNNKSLTCQPQFALYEMQDTRYATKLLSTFVERTLQISFFMQNKPNSRKAKNERKKCYNNELQRFYPDARVSKQSQFKPKQTQFKTNYQKGKIDANCAYTKDYEEKCG